MEGYPGLFEDRLEYQLQDIRKIATLHQNWILKKVNDLQIVVERSLQESQFPTPFFLFSRYTEHHHQPRSIALNKGLPQVLDKHSTQIIV